MYDGVGKLECSVPEEDEDAANRQDPWSSEVGHQLSLESGQTNTLRTDQKSTHQLSATDVETQANIRRSNKFNELLLRNVSNNPKA